jgi:hypothetical protein
MARGGTIFGAAAVLAALVGWGGAALAGPRCTAVARVSGAPALAGSVVALLRERGVPVTGESACGVISAVVASEEERVRVTIIDSDGRVVERMVDDAEGAATAVESWARGDLLDPLLAAREVPARPAMDREAPRAIEIEDESRPAARRVDVAALAEAALSNDGALWAGARAQGCVEIGATCIGAMLRYAVDTEVEGTAADQFSHRSAIDLLLVGEVPIDLDRGRFSITPGLGVGLGALRANREEECDECSDEATALLLRGQLAGTARINRSWDIRLDLFAVWAPFAEKKIGEIDMDPNDEPWLAGAPSWVSGVGLGLVYGGL